MECPEGDCVVEVLKNVSISGTTLALSTAVAEGRFTHILVRYVIIHYIYKDSLCVVIMIV